MMERTSPPSIVQAWLDSAGPRRLVLKRGFRDVGIGLQPAQVEQRRLGLAHLGLELAAAAVDERDLARDIVYK